MESDPYKVLRVPRSATLEQVKAAYHRAALECHPDVSPDDPQQAVQRFQQINEAYRAILLAFRPTYTPAEFACLDVGWLYTPQSPAEFLSRRPAPGEAGTALCLRRPTRDENVAFVCLWLVACAAASAAAFLWLKFHMLTKFEDDLRGLDYLLLTLLPLGIYVGILGVSGLLLVLTREIVWLTFGRGPRRALPAPKPQFPKPPGALRGG